MNHPSDSERMKKNESGGPDVSVTESRDLMPDKSKLPVLPLRDTVVYPGVAVPISAGRPGTIEAVQSALDGDRRLFAVAQRENVDEPTPEVLYNVGTIVRIIQTHRVRGGVQVEAKEAAAPAAGGGNQPAAAQ